MESIKNLKDLFIGISIRIHSDKYILVIFLMKKFIHCSLRCVLKILSLSLYNVRLLCAAQKLRHTVEEVHRTGSVTRTGCINVSTVVS